METQLLYVVSILMAVGFGYFVKSTMFGSERNKLIAQGRQAADVERAELTQQLEAQETRVKEIEKEREQERALFEKMREENAKLHILHNEADERVAEARRSTEEHWQQIVADARLQQSGTEAITQSTQDDRPTHEQLQEAVEEARRATGEEWQKAVVEARRSTEEHWQQIVADARQEAESRLRQSEANAAPQAAEDDRPTHEQLQQAVEDARRAADEQWLQAVEEARRSTEEHWQQVLAEARKDADNERAKAAEQIAAQSASWEAKLATVTAELQKARQEAAAAAVVPVPVPVAPASSLAPSHESMIEAFRGVAAEALQANNEKFLDLARVALERIQETAHAEPADYSTAVNELIDPIRETLAKVDSNLGQMEKERQSSIENLTGLVNNLIQQGKDLRHETTSLARALRSGGTHGRWGELQLRRVVELAGMIEHCDYDGQPAPGGPVTEMIVHLPNHRDIIVDANVSLSAYLDSLEALDEPVRTEKLRQHAAGVRAHLQRLSSASYWNQFPSAPEFVVAFLPSETVFSAALEHDPSLIEFGAENRVILATPTTLIALLKATAYGWKQQQLADDARTVRELGKDLYERLASFTGHLDDLRRNLERSVESYNRGVSSLESRVLTTARRFQELTAASEPEIPVLGPVETVPRSLQALESATVAEPISPAAIEAPTQAPAAPPQTSVAKADVPVIELPIVPPMAPVIVCEPRVVSEAHIVSEPRVVSEPHFINESEPVGS